MQCIHRSTLIKTELITIIRHLRWNLPIWTTLIKINIVILKIIWVVNRQVVLHTRNTEKSRGCGRDTIIVSLTSIVYIIFLIKRVVSRQSSVIEKGYVTWRGTKYICFAFHNTGHLRVAWYLIRSRQQREPTSDRFIRVSRSYPLTNSRVDINRLKDTSYEVIISVLITDEDITAQSTLDCELRIPDTPYVKRKTFVFFQGKCASVLSSGRARRSSPPRRTRWPTRPDRRPARAGPRSRRRERARQ